MNQHRSQAGEGRWQRRSRLASEALLLLLVCAAPWAFGSVEAWAQFVIVVAVALLGVLRLPQVWCRSTRPALRCIPSVGLAGLVALGLLQVAPWPRAVLDWLAPGSARLREQLLPAAPERVAGDPGPAVPLPRRSISTNPEATIQAAAGLACGWIVFQSVLALAGGSGPFRRFAFVVVANTAVLSLFSIIQRVAWDGKIYWMREAPAGCAGPFVDHNHLAAYLDLGLGLALGFLLAPGSARNGPEGAGQGVRVWAWYAAGLVAAGVVVSLSRSGFLGMVAALVGASLLLRGDRRRWAAGLGAAVVLCGLFLWAVGGAEGQRKRLATLLGSDPYAYRLRVWAGALRAWPQAPVLGAGLGTFPTATARFYRFDAGETYFHAENEYVEWLVEGGALGLGLVLATVAGTVALGHRALRAAPTSSHRALIVGGGLSILALVVHSGGDFALHIPGVALAAIALSAHLARLGLRASAAAAPAQTRPSWSRVPALGVAVAALGIALVVPAFRHARAEVYRGYAQMPLDGSLMQSLTLKSADRAADAPDLDVARASLTEALRDRPNWAEGHTALGLVCLRLYEQSAHAALARQVDDAGLAARFSRPLWLSLRVRTADPNAPLTAATLLELDAVRSFLVPAARAFLEARRCDCLRPLPYTKLAVLSFLLEGGDPGRAYLERALTLAGGSGLEYERVDEVAVVWGELDLATRCWRNELVLRVRPWTQVADLARMFLEPDRTLREVVPDGPHAVRFAQFLFTAPADRRWRKTYAEESLRRLDHDRTLPAADRLALRAEAHQLLDQRDKARVQMIGALALRPDQSRWRKTLVEWLIAWDRLDDAHDQARLAVSLAPGDPDATAALELAADALAHAGDAPARGGDADDVENQHAMHGP